MSDYHCWNFFRRVMRVAITIVFATVAYCHTSALAAESTVQAAKTVTISGESEGFLNAPITTIKTVRETHPLTPTSVSEAGDPIGLTEASPSIAGALSAVQPAGGEGLIAQNTNISFSGNAAGDAEIHEVVLGVQRKRDTLSNTLIGAEKEFKYFVPLYQLSRTLKFPSQYDAGAQKISGYYLLPQNTYEIDLQNNSYTVKGETATLPPGGAFAYANSFDGNSDIYVSLEVANLLWSLNLELDLSNLAVAVNSPKKLPYEIERERKKLQDKLNAQDTGLPPDLDLISTPSGYRWLGPQVFGLSTRLSHSKRAGLQSATSVSGRGDLLGFGANYTLSTVSNEEDKFDANNARILLSRKGYGNNKTLPLGLKELEIGDLIVDANRLTSQTVRGRGIYVNSSEDRRSRGFSEVTLSGIAEPGWEIELYRYKQLIDFGIVDDNGQYVFENVLLQVGDNEFKIVLYGPQGQIEERIENYPVGSKFLKPGEMSYEATLVENNVPVFDLRPVQPNEKLQGPASFIRVNRGINHRLSGFATLQRLPTSFGDKSYASVGAEFTALGGAGRAELSRDIENSGTALDLVFSKKFGGLNTTLETTAYRDFESPLAGFGESARTFDGRFRAFRNFELPFADVALSGFVQHQERKNGTSRSRINSVQSAAFDNFAVSHTLNSNYVDGDRSNTQGTLSLNKRVGQYWATRGALNYNTYPDTELDDFQFNLNYNDRDKLTSNLNFVKDLNDDGNTRVSLNTSYDFGTFLGGTTFGWDSENGTSVLLTANTTIGPDGEDGVYRPTTEYRGFTTALEAKLYTDVDKDGQFSEGDIPLEGAKLLLGKRKTEPTDKNGYVQALNAGPPGLIAVTLDRDSMPDPFLVGLKDGYSAILRPGTKPFINFPLYPSGSIDGTVRYANGRSANGLIVQLLDVDGNLVQEVPTLFDGFYVFEYVREGSYTVQLSPSHQVNVPPKTVKVTSDDLFAYGVDLILLEQAAEVLVTDDLVRDGGRVAQLNHALVADGTLQPAPFSTDGLFDTVVNSVRIGEHPYKVRLVLDLSEPTTYKISSEKDGKIVNIDLPKTAWEATREWKLGKHPLFEECGVYSINNGTGTRLRLTGRKPVSLFYNAAIPKENGLPDRIYVDFLKK